MKHRHRMPFGAEILDDAAVRFRLWAPRAQNLAVEVDSKSLPMRALDDGWFELTTREAGPGTRYESLSTAAIEFSIQLLFTNFPACAVRAKSSSGGVRMATEQLPRRISAKTSEMIY